MPLLRPEFIKQCDAAREIISAFAGYYDLQRKEPPTEGQVAYFIRAAHIRGAELDSEAWLQLWKLGRQRLHEVACVLQQHPVELDEASAAVVRLFAPDDTYNPQAALSA